MTVRLLLGSAMALTLQAESGPGPAIENLGPDVQRHSNQATHTNSATRPTAPTYSDSYYNSFQYTEKHLNTTETMSSAPILGKRKRKPAQKVEDDNNPDAPALEDAQAIFRRYFEAQFAPLEDKPKTRTDGKKSSKSGAESDGEEDGDGVEDMRSDSESEGDNEWGGLSGEDDSKGA